MRLDLPGVDETEAGNEGMLVGRQGRAEISLGEACFAQHATPSNFAMSIGLAVLCAWHAMHG
jgi:hypothetical protein